ncbi:coenzyme F390 synthetase [Brevibacillus panacihumi W25]|uniref:Coenzyme F390 synthetase n=1 Tax=Brevibacillus panacihumi W25 TaxID=1408254 RepID=V6M9G6_9BACL|nr:coenzyme F390 synthetase [Brevibacillus panacihumi W25]
MPATGFWIRRIQWPMMELIKENRTRHYMAELQRAQSLQTNALVESQRKKLGKLLDHATRRVPAYTEFASEWETQRDQPERFLQRLPILRKSHFRQNADQYLAQHANPAKLIGNRTGGSTGEPTRFYLDRLAVERYEAARWLGLSWHGIQIGDPCVMIWGSPLELNQQQERRYRWKERWLKNRLILSAYELDREQLPTYLRLIQRFQPVYLYGYASALHSFAEMMLERGLSLGIRLKAVVSTAESLHAHQRQTIESAFEAPVINEYGARDGGMIAYQCPSGQMHIFSENCYLEVVDPLTVMPRLRYQLGDMIALSPQSCDCGINFPVLEKIDGREDDMFISTHGKIVHGHYFNHIIRGMDSFRTFQIVQHEPSRLSLKLVKDPDSYLPADESRLLAGIQAALGEVNVQVAYVDHIPPSASGKVRYAIRECPLTTAPRME